MRTYTEYWNNVDGAALDVAERDNFEDAIGEEELIYTCDQIACMQHTDNDDAAFDAEGEITIGSVSEFYERVAVWAYQADIRDRLQRVAVTVTGADSVFQTTIGDSGADGWRELAEFAIEEAGFVAGKIPNGPGEFDAEDSDGNPVRLEISVGLE